MATQVACGWAESMMKRANQDSWAGAVMPESPFTLDQQAKNRPKMPQKSVAKNGQTADRTTIMGLCSTSTVQLC